MKFYIFIILFFSIIVSSCSTREEKQVSEPETVVVSDTVAAADTVVIDTLIPPTGQLRTEKAAIDYMTNSGHWEKFKEGILPRMAKENLPYANKLLHNKFKRFIVVDKGKMKVQLYDKFGRKEIEYGMACGKNFGTKHEKADSRTPEGFFSVEGIYDSTDWLFTDDDGYTSPKKGQFGPRFIRLRIPTTSQIGIHGTCAPWSIGARASHGCIRVTNENILKLVELVEVGMPVIVNPGSRDMRTNLEEGYEVPYITTDNIPIKIPKIIKRDTINADSLLTDSLMTDSIIRIDTLAVDTLKAIKLTTDSSAVGVETKRDSLASHKPDSTATKNIGE